MIDVDRGGERDVIRGRVRARARGLPGDAGDGSKTRAPWYAIGMGAPEDEARTAAIAAIVAEGRAMRRRPSRPMWIAAAIVSAVCAIGFVLLIAPDGGPDSGPDGGPDSAPDGPREPVRAPARARRTGCVGGFGLGLGLGVAIGFALGARRRGGGAPSGLAAQDGSINRPA